jgi:hypothetical protein
VDPLDVVHGQFLRPGDVVERVGDDVTGCAVSLQFEYVDPAVAVDGRDVEVTAVVGRDLPPENEQVVADHGRILDEEVRS